MYIYFQPYTYIYLFLNDIHICSGQNIDPQIAPIHKFYKTRLKLRNIQNKKHAHYNAHFKEELDSLKANIVRIDSLLKQALRMPLVKVFPIDLTLFFKLK